MSVRSGSLARVLIALSAALLIAVPAAEALDIGTRAAKARPSTEYSPDTAWDVGYYGCGVTIAVFDEGIDDEHPLLQGKVVAGYDATDTKEVWTQANGGNPQPVVGSHGTPVAGLAASHGGTPFFAAEDAPEWAEDELVGMAPCAWLVDVQFSDLGADSEGLISNMVEAFQWAVDNIDNDWGDDDSSNDGIDVITMSWSPLDGTDGSDELSQAANAAVEAGIVVLGSMGNSGPEYRDWGTPAAADLTIGVAALYDQRTVTRDDDEIIFYSTIGPRPDDGDDDPYDELKPTIAAPAHNVVGPGAAFGDGSEYQTVCFGSETLPVGLPYECETQFGGTSAATPMTAGAVALVLQANPDLSPLEVREILHQSAEAYKEQEPDAPELHASYNHTYGRGMLDAYRAVQLALAWPGPEMGFDTDGDGVRDFQDVAPDDPTVTDLVDTVFEAAGGGVDSDGDGVPDQDDGAPLDPFSTISSEPEETQVPAPAVGLLLVAMAAMLLARRRA